MNQRVIEVVFVSMLLFISCSKPEEVVIKLYPTQVSLVEESSTQLQVTVSPGAVSDYTLHWESSSPVIASVAIGNDGGYCNVNADVVAGQIAAAAEAARHSVYPDLRRVATPSDQRLSNHHKLGGTRLHRRAMPRRCQFIYLERCGYPLHTRFRELCHFRNL